MQEFIKCKVLAYTLEVQIMNAPAQLGLASTNPRLSEVCKCMQHVGQVVCFTIEDHTLPIYTVCTGAHQPTFGHLNLCWRRFPPMATSLSVCSAEAFSRNFLLEYTWWDRL